MLYEFFDYKAYLRSFIKSQPKAGRGLLKRMAEAMDLTSAQMSHVTAGDADFTLEQALKASKFLGLNPAETEYFVEMVSMARAGTKDFQNYSRNKLERMRSQALQLKNQVPTFKELSDAEKAVFYSSWLYSAIRLFCSIKETSLEEIIDYFQISRPRASDIIQFLVATGLCLQKESGYVMGPQSTFVSKDSPFIFKHHSNWRIKAIENSENLSERDLMFTAPISLSQKDLDLIRIRLTEMIKEISAQVKDSPAENLACLCLDLFQVKPKKIG